MTTRETKHTPGPWLVATDERTVITGLSTCDYEQICACECGSHHFEVGPTPVLPSDIHAELLANARLIAAAPELYEIIKRFFEQDIPCPFRGNDEQLEDWCKWFRDAEAAVAKAEGK